MKLFGNKNNVLILVQKIGNQYKETDRIKFKKNEDLVSNKKHTVPIPPNNPYMFSTDKVNFLFFDIGNKKYLTFEKTDLGLSTSFLDKLFNNKLIEQLANAVKRSTDKDNTNMDWIKEVMKFGGCVLIGYLLGISFGG